MNNYKSTIEMIGQTPMLEATQLDTGCCQLFIKLECQNPGGSIKDRIALNMIETAEREGKLKPGGTIVEATAGNTGLGLAIVAILKGYKSLIVMPDKMSREKIFHLRAMGAEVVMTRSDVNKGHPEYYQDLAESLVKDMDNAFYVNQFANKANVEAHYKTTGPEIWQQMEGNIDAFVAGVGTGGTMTGAGGYLREQNPDIDLILADPKGSILTDYVNEGIMGEANSWLVEGIGEDFIPSICNIDSVTRAIRASDQQSFDAARELLVKEGVLAGSSSGTLLHAALTYCREQTKPKRVVTFACDTGNKYLSKLYNDYWMLDHGFLEREIFGDLRDVISRRHAEHATVTVTIDDLLSTVHNRMRLHEVSQIPVMQDNNIVGIVDESDLLLAVHNNQDGFSTSVSNVMSTNLVIVKRDESLAEVLSVLKDNYVALVMNGSEFDGIITKIDVINFLRRKAS